MARWPKHKTQLAQVGEKMPNVGLARVGLASWQNELGRCQGDPQGIVLRRIVVNSDARNLIGNESKGENSDDRRAETASWKV